MKKDYIQVDESTLPVIDNEKHRAVKGYMWAVRDAVGGSVYFHYDMGARSGETAVKLIGKYRGAVQTDGYEVYESFENAPGKLMIGCWAHVRCKFVEALDEDRKHASEAIVYISKLYKLEADMKEAKLKPDAIKERREKEAYPIIQDFEKWMNTVAGNFSPRSRMGKAIVYTYSLLPRLSRYILDGRYNIDNNGVENAIRPLALVERTISSVAITMPQCVQLSYTHSSPPAKHTILTSGTGLKTRSKGSPPKRILQCFSLKTGSQ